jgi:hypothetical protein
MNYALIEYELLLEEVAKLPKTTDTCGVTPDVLKLVYERIFYYGEGL